VNFPPTHKTGTAIALAIGIAVTSALMIVGPGSAAATAGRLIGSADIKNNTVRSRDIRNGTVTGRDVKDGSLSAKDLSGALRGATGPRGPAGTSGDRAQTIRAWDVQSAGAPPGFSVTSSSLPPATQVEVVKLTISGAFSSCSSVSVRVLMNGQILASTRSFGTPATWHPDPFVGGGLITSEATPLTLTVSCGGMGTEPVPAFEAVVTLAQTARNTSATSALH
jgi:hypothetical protein